MQKFTSIVSKVVPLLVDNVDTDQIIPARFLKVTDKAGLGEALFADWRYNSDGSPKPDFVLNLQEMKGRQILLVGDNFGCGSSREHAPWALVGYGFRVVISTSFADIFRNNALKNGLLPVILDQQAHSQLVQACQDNPDLELTVDLETQTIKLPDGRSASFPIDAFSKTCLLNGVDEIGYVLGLLPQIEAYESARQK
ncbi:MAG: 3-isopropylmalate dehydratase small subunit [Thermoflexales bacterium]